jgi:hypothetical protein
VFRVILNVCIDATESKEGTAVIHFFTLEGLKAEDIHAELEWLYGPEAFALPMVKSGGDGFNNGERMYLRIPGPEGPWRMILLRQLALCLQKGRSHRAWCFVSISESERRPACGSLTTNKLDEIPFSLGLYALSVNQKNERMSYLKLFLTALMEDNRSILNRL